MCEKEQIPRPVKKEEERGGAAGADSEFTQQPREKTMAKQVVP